MNIATHDSIDIEKEIAQWVAALSLSDIPGDALDVARDCVADGIGTMFAGTQSSVFELILRLPQYDGRCTVADSSVSVDALSAAFRNGVACHAWDFDDTSYAGVVHGTAVVLPAVLAVAQEVGASGAQFLEAFVAGVEVEYAIGLALTDSLYDRGHWTTTALGVVGAAVGAAKLLKLPSARIADAIRLAANMSFGLRAIHGSTGKPYLCGMAAKMGIEAAYAAEAGVQAQINTFGRRHGFAATLNSGVLKYGAIDSLGTRYLLVNPGIAYKLRPLCSAAQAAVDATIFLKDEYGITVHDVESVQCFATELVVSCLTYVKPVLPSEAQFSMQFAIGCALLHGDIRVEHLSEIVLSNPVLAQLMQRIKLQSDVNLIPATDAISFPEAARVEIQLRDRRIVDKTVCAALGMPKNPVDESRLLQKFLDCTAPMLGADAAQLRWATIHRVDHMPDVHDLLRQQPARGR